MVGVNPLVPAEIDDSTIVAGNLVRTDPTGKFLVDAGAASVGFAVTVSWGVGINPGNPNGDGQRTILIAPKALTIVGLQFIPDVGNDSHAMIFVVKNGTPIHSDSFNATGTTGIVQTLTPTTTTLAAGDLLGLTTAGTFGMSVGNVTVYVQ